jgi:methionyl-tRNA formyltransferase
MLLSLIYSGNMEVIFLGVNDIGLRIYEWLCQRDHVEMIAMLTEQNQLDLIQKQEPDLVVSVGFDYLVPSEVLDVPSEGALNLHPSFLPYNRGKSPNVWPLIEGTPAGVTLHYMNTEFDTGDIIAQRKVETDFSDTGKELHERLEEAQFDLITDVWPEIEAGEIERTPQEDSAGNYHSKADFIDLCELDPQNEVRIKEFLDRLRALTFPPFDNAYIEIDDEKYYVDIDITKAVNESEDKTDGLLSSY